MGIDIYLEWDDITEEEKQAQATGFSVVSGDVGYLREAYHGGPYATRLLVREAFESPDCVAEIPAATMRERLTGLTEPAYNANVGHVLAARVLELMRKTGDTMNADAKVKTDTTRPMTVEEAVRERCSRLYPDEPAEFADRCVQSFKDFVALAERKEKQTGKPCRVFASY